MPYTVTIGDYSCDTGDILGVFSGNQFSSYDNDNDANGVDNNADITNGGFWHDSSIVRRCLVTGGQDYFYCILPEAYYLKTVRMWLMCK